MKTKYDIVNTAEEISEALTQVEHEFDFPSHFYQSFFGGKREIYQTEFSQVKQFDENWIRAIEAYYPSLVTITKRLKSSLKNIEEILPIEKTKKIGPRSIRHLSSHSELIRDVDDNDEVVPGRLLSAQAEIEYGIYENRFVMTLIKRLMTFINERIKIIEAEMEGVRDTHLKYETNFKFIEAEYDMSIDVRQKETVTKKANEHNINVFERAKRLQKLVSRLNNGQFMRVMKKYKKVSSPIMRTQVILKNADFKKAYLLWLYLDKYYVLDYKMDTKTTNKRFKSEYSKALDQTMMNVFTVFFNNDHKELNGESNGNAKYRSKKAVRRNKLVNEFVVDPKVLEVEQYVSNEYFLNAQEKLFDKSYKEIMNVEKRYTIGLKNALTQNLKITNDLYAKFFEINQDKDVFDILIKGEDPIEELDDVTKKLKIARTIREVKQKDYQQAIKLEKKWLRTMRQKQREMISFESANASQRIKDKIALLESQYDLVKESQERDFLRRKENLIRNNREEVNGLSNKLKDKLVKEKNDLRQKEKDTLAIKKEKVAKIKEHKLSIQQEKNKRQMDRLHKKFIERKAKLRSIQREKILKERENSAKKTKIGKEKIDAQLVNQLNKQKEDHLKKVDDITIKINAIEKKILESES